MKHNNRITYYKVKKLAYLYRVALDRYYGYKKVHYPYIMWYAFHKIKSNNN